MPLILLGAPLGNPADASARFRETIIKADIVAAEDTRRLARLCADLDLVLTGRVVSYFEGNEQRRTPELLEALTLGVTVALVTDAGMPSVSDPGYRLVHAAVQAGIPVTTAPGPSAVTTALAVSGLPCDRFCFEGFLPRRPAERRSTLAELAAEPRTMIFFESPHRVADTLADMVAAFGADRQAALCRELTKTYEEVRRLSLGELADSAGADHPRGEITLVVHGAPPPALTQATPEELATAVEDLEAEGTQRKPAIAAVAKRYGLPKREVYDAVVRSKAAED